MENLNIEFCHVKLINNLILTVYVVIILKGI